MEDAGHRVKTWMIGVVERSVYGKGWRVTLWPEERNEDKQDGPATGDQGIVCKDIDEIECTQSHCGS